VPVRDPQRIGAGVAVDLDTKDRIIRVEIAGGGGADHGRIVERRDAIDDHTAPGDLLDADFVGDSGVYEAAESRIDPREQVCKEPGISRVWR
jgi:hypothetical protein